MGFDNECILNIQSLAGEYFCPVCRLLVYPNEALQSQCTHLYCKPCLTYVVSTTRACPYDGYLVTEADSKPLVESNKALAETIGKILVHCLYHRSGCAWQGPLSECTSHCAGCAFGNSPVVCNRCGVQIVHRQVQEHAQNCPGVQPQAQQAEGVQEAVGPGTTASSTTTQPVAATTTATASQTAVVDPNQQVNLTTQPQAVAQAAAPTPEQWYQQQQQQQQQYQQYYQQYPGSYDPYQQQYQQYNPYQSQPVQQFAQQHVQAAGPQTLGQPPQQMYAQPHLQAQSHVQPPLQPQAQGQIPSQIAGQPQPHPHVQAPVLAQNPNQAAVTPQQPHPTIPQHSQIQAQPHPVPYGQPQPFPQAQPHPQHHQQLPQHQQPHAHTQHAPPQIQPLHGSQIHPQHPIPQTQQLQHQPPPQLPSQPNQPQSHIAQHQGPPHPSAHGATQSHPHHQIPTGASQPHPMHTPYQNGAPQQSQHPVQMQGQYPHPPPHMRPPHAPMPNQQQATTLASQGQPPNIPSAQQLPVHPNAQQPGQPPHQRPVQPIQQPAPQLYAQQQPFPVPHQGHFGQQLPPPPQSQLRPQGPPHSLQQTSQAYPQSQQNVALSHGMQSHQIQNHAGRPMMQNSGIQSQPFPLAPGAPGGIQARPTQLGANQIYPQPGYAQHPLISQSGLTTKATVMQGDAETHSQGIVKKDANGVAVSSGIAVDSANVKSGTDTKTTDNEQKKIVGAEDKSNLAEPDNGSGEPVIKRTVKEETTDKRTDEKVGLDQSDAPQQGDLADEQSAKLHQNAVDVAGEKGPAEVVPPVSTPIPEGTIPEHAKGRNHLPLMPYGPSHQQRPGAPSVLQSMPPGPPPLHAQLPGHPFNSQGILGPGSAASFGRGPSHVGPHRNFEPPPQGPYNQGHMPPPGVGGPPLPPPPGSFDIHGGMMPRGGPHGPEGEMFPSQRPGFFDGRQPNPHLPGSLERGPFGQSSGLPTNAKLNGGPGLDSSATLGFLDPSRHMIGRGEFEEDLKQFPRPSNLDAEKLGSFTRLAERGFGMDAPPRHNYDSGLKFDANPDTRFLPPHRQDFPVPGFGRHHADGLNQRSPGREYSGMPSRGFSIHSGPDDFDGKRQFGEGSKSSILPTDPVGSSFHESGFPALPSHLRRGEFDGQGNVKTGEHIGSGPQNQMRRGDFMGPAGFGTFPPPGRPPIGELSIRGNFPQGESFFGGNKSGHPRLGEPGFRSSYSLHGYPNEGPFPRGDVEAFDNLRKRKPPNMGWCRICKIDCETVEGLDLHSQTREHQKMAMDMVISIKQQNAKRLQKLSSNDHSSLEEAKKSRNTGFEGRGNKH